MLSTPTLAEATALVTAGCPLVHRTEDGRVRFVRPTRPGRAGVYEPRSRSTVGLYVGPVDRALAVAFGEDETGLRIAIALARATRGFDLAACAATVTGEPVDAYEERVLVGRR